MDKVRDGVKAIIYSRDCFLLTLRDGRAKRFPYCWHFPGGGIEDNEKPKEAVRREIEEELCFSSNEYQYIKKIEGLDGGKLYLFSLKIDRLQEDNFKIGNEGLEYKFMTLNEMEGIKLTDHTKMFVREERNLLLRLLSGN